MKANRKTCGNYKNFTQSRGKFKKGQKIDSQDKRDIDPASMRCPYCGGRMILREHEYVPHAKSSRPLMVCENYPSCDSYCTVVKKETKVRLISTPANRQLRLLRREAHYYMDILIENNIFRTREDIYWYLTDKDAGGSANQVHVGFMQEYGCQKTIKSCVEAIYNNRSRIKSFIRFKEGYSNKEPEIIEMLDEIGC